MNPNPPAMTTHLIFLVLTIGLCAGILSGLVGVGGGIIVVPALVFALGYTQHQAQGTSLGLLSLPVVALAFLTYYQQAKGGAAAIDFKVIGLLAVGFLAGGWLGAQLAIRIDQAVLKKIFAVILFYTAFKMLGWDKWFFNLFK